MSAFQVSHAHINALLHFHQTRGPQYRPNELVIYTPTPNFMRSRIIGPWHEDSTWIAAATLLWDENQRSLHARYESAPDPYDVRHYYGPAFVAPLSPVEALKACDCYDYQACESRDYELTEACALVDQIRGGAIRRLAGYEDASWEIIDSRFTDPPTHRITRIV